MHRLLALSCVILLILGCSKDNPVAPQANPPALSEIWPSETGLLWTYSSVYRSWDHPALLALYSSLALVPPVTFDTVAAVLAARPAGSNPTTDTAQFQLVFGDEITLPTGIVVRTLSELPAGPTRAGRFLHGGYWRRTSQWIGTQSLSDTLPDWKFLEADLTPGHTFTFPLLPGLAPGVGLHARIVRSLAVPTPGGTIANGIEVHYFIDYGIGELTDESGNPLGLAHPFSCGSVLYAPGVGPVRDDERSGLFAGQSLRPGYGDILISLVAGPQQTLLTANRAAR